MNKNKANLYFKAISKRGALTETDKHLFMNVNVDDEAAMFLFDTNNQMTEQPKQAGQTEITIIFKDGYSFKGTVEQLKQRLQQSENKNFLYQFPITDYDNPFWNSYPTYDRRELENSSTEILKAHATLDNRVKSYDVATFNQILREIDFSNSFIRMDYETYPNGEITIKTKGCSETYTFSDFEDLVNDQELETFENVEIRISLNNNPNDSQNSDRTTKKIKK